MNISASSAWSRNSSCRSCSIMREKQLDARRTSAFARCSTSPVKKPSTSICSSWFHQRFTDDFGTRCDVIGPPQAVAAKVLSHDPLAVALADPPHRVDVAIALSRRHLGLCRDRPPVQEFAQASLDGGGAARQARHLDGRGARRRARRSGDPGLARRNTSSSQHVPRRSAQDAVRRSTSMRSSAPPAPRSTRTFARAAHLPEQHQAMCWT